MFTCNFTIYGYVTNSPRGKLSVDLIVQSVENCTGIAEVMGSTFFQAFISQLFMLYTYVTCLHIVSHYHFITISFKYDDDFFQGNKYVDGNMIFCLFLQIPLFQQHPHLKQFVRPAIERAVQELVHPVVERSIKICLTTAEMIVKKVRF